MTYQPRTHYTKEELLRAEISDLETDHRCALRDGLVEYAESVKKQLETKRAELAEVRTTK